VAEMLAAGIVPGILSAIAYSLWIMFSGWRMRRQEQNVDADNVQDALDQATEINAAKLEKSPLGQLPWRGLVYIGLLFAIVLGGMYSGIFTATESAAFGAIAAGLMLLFELRKEGAKGIWDGITNALKSTAAAPVMMCFIEIVSIIHSSLSIAARAPDMIAEAVLSWNIAPALAMPIRVVSLLPLGMALASVALLTISVPLLLPVAVKFG